MNERIDTILNFIREARDESDSLSEHVMLFTAFMLIACGSVMIATVLVMLPFMLPRVFIPIYLIIFVAWKGYHKL